MRGVCEGIDTAHDGSLADGHEDDAVHRRTDSTHHSSQQPIDRRSKEPTKHHRHLCAQEITVEVNEEERQESERQGHEAARHLHSDDARPFDHGGAGVHAPGIAGRSRPEVLRPELVHPAVEPWQLTQP